MRYDPLAPIPPRALRRQVRRDVSANISPLVRQINARVRSGSQNISGTANELAQQLGGFSGRAHDIYSGAERRLGQIDSELADRLGGSGGADELRARLAAAGQDTSLADALAGAAHGASGAGFARGAAERGQLNTQGALAAEYGAKLPGLARLSGLQGIRQREAQGQQQLGDLQARVPGLVASTLRDARNLEFQKAAANLGFAGTTAKIGAQVGYQNQRNATTKRGQDLSHQDRQATIQERKSAASQKNRQAQVKTFYGVREKAFKAAAGLYKGTAVKSSGGNTGGGYGGPGGSGTSTTYKRVPPQDAYRRLYVTYASPLLNTGYSHAQVQRVLVNAMHAAGYGFFNVPGSGSRGPVGRGRGERPT